MTHPSRIPLSIAERKHRMPYGAQKQVAAEEQVSEQYVSGVMNDEVKPKTEKGAKKLRRVQVAIARKLRMRVDEVFPPDQQASAISPGPAPVAIPA